MADRLWPQRGFRDGLARKGRSAPFEMQQGGAGVNQCSLERVKVGLQSNRRRLLGAAGVAVVGVDHRGVMQPEDDR